MVFTSLYIQCVDGGLPPVYWVLPLSREMGVAHSCLYWVRPHITPVVRWVQNFPQTVTSRASLLPLRFKAFPQVPRCRTHIINPSAMPLRFKIWSLKTRHGR